MNACPGSGSLADYITSLQGTNPSLATTTAAEWQQLRAEGAVGAAISLFAADLATCSAELAATSKGKSVASLVAVFGDEGQADRAWESGILGFVPPAPGEQAPGLNRGTTTGLGLSAWTYDRSPVRFACWRHSVFVALVVLTNLDLATFKSMTAAVDARLN